MATPAAQADTTLDPGTTRARLAKVYAEALMEAAASSNAVDSVGHELTAFVNDVLVPNPQVGEFLASPAFGRKYKAAALAEALPGRASDLFRNFMTVLNQTGRLALLRNIEAAYRGILDEKAGRVRVRVAAAAPLEHDQQEQLSRTLAEALHKQPVLDVRVDPDLIGGLVVRVGDRVIDTSVRSRLQSLRTLLKNEGVSHGR